MSFFNFFVIQMRHVYVCDLGFWCTCQLSCALSPDISKLNFYGSRGNSFGVVVFDIGKR